MIAFIDVLSNSWKMRSNTNLPKTFFICEANCLKGEVLDDLVPSAMYLYFIDWLNVSLRILDMANIEEIGELAE